jgi:hypothetical protein
MTSGELLKYRKGLCIAGGYGTSVSVSSRFGLTLPHRKLSHPRPFVNSYAGVALCWMWPKNMV